MTRAGWNTSVGDTGKGHFYTDDKTDCADRKGIWPGCTLGDLFSRPTRATVDGDHLCRYCAGQRGRECVCFRCVANKQSRALAAKRLIENRALRAKQNKEAKARAPMMRGLTVKERKALMRKEAMQANGLGEKP